MLRRLASIISLFLCLAAFVSGQELKGTWVGSIEADDFFGALRLDFSGDPNQAGSKVTLYYAGDKRNGTIELFRTSGDEVTFEGKMQPLARFSGKVAGEKIGGTFNIVSRSGAVSGTGVWETRRVDPASITETAKAAPATAVKFELPKPTGKSAIGRSLFHWVDESRAETITDDPADKRRLFVQLWYPASNARTAAAAPYIPDLEELRRAEPNIPDLTMLRTHAVVDAAPAKGERNFPLIVFSPGLGSSPFGYTTIIENLVSHGYAVAAINHPYDTANFKSSDGSIVAYAGAKWDREAPKDWTADERKKFFDDRRLQWAADASFVVDQLSRQNSAISKRLDFTNLGMLGHSFGGQAASIVCAADARFKACANLDGQAQGNAFLPDSSGKVIRQPFLFFTKAPEVTNFELSMMGLSRQEYRSRELKRFERFKPGYKTRMASLESGGHLLTFLGAKHSSFSDSPLYDSRSEQSYDERVKTAKAVNEYVLSFFDKYLLGKANTLLDGKVKSQHNVIVQYLKHSPQP
ncbi:MAG TPA: hypothetical protein VNA17_03360 [Pyrinomonadaceae bacterium]|nr:hypothetical protein [Pyrinomonadaceae bacterium]